MGTAPKDATAHTKAANAPVDLGFDEADFERAARGLVATHPTGVIESASSKPRSTGALAALVCAVASFGAVPMN